MTLAVTAPRIDIAAELAEQVLDDLRASGSPKLLDGAFLSQETANSYRGMLARSEPALDTVDKIQHNLTDPAGPGYVVLTFESLIDNLDVRTLEALVTVLLSGVARPLRVFDKWPLWKPLTTNLSARPERAMGVGYNPMHIDVVNSTSPPDFVALLCVRPDPLAQGYSLVAPLRESVRAISARASALLSEAAFVDGAFYDLSGVGREYSPFPVLDGLPESIGFVRFTAKMLAERDPDDPHTVAARELETALLARSQRFLLDRGEVLVVNQHLICHGREALGPAQHALAPEARRLLHQMFLRAEPATDSAPGRIAGSPRPAIGRSDGHHRGAGA